MLNLALQVVVFALKATSVDFLVIVFVVHYLYFIKSWSEATFYETVIMGS